MRHSAPRGRCGRSEDARHAFSPLFALFPLACIDHSPFRATRSLRSFVTFVLGPHTFIFHHLDSLSLLLLDPFTHISASLSPLPVDCSCRSGLAAIPAGWRKRPGLVTDPCWFFHVCRGVIGRPGSTALCSLVLGPGLPPHQAAVGTRLASIPCCILSCLASR